MGEFFRRLFEGKEPMWLVLGFTGNAIFFSRFLVQWAVSEKRKESVIPVIFWYLSIVGSLLLLSYFVYRMDPVGMLAYLPNCFVYYRNLVLIRRRGGSLAPFALTGK